MQNSYTILNASAGSGKTYALVQRLLMICLRHPNHYQHIKRILALTFTNKAANEMKSRILDWLKKFTAKDYDQCRILLALQEAMQAEGIQVSVDELSRRAQNLLDYILHHYSVLSIGTIDKFNAKLIRSFSQELGLGQNFNLEINTDPLLIEAVDQLMEKVGTEDELSDTLIDHAFYHLEQDKRVQMKNVLLKSAKNLIPDTNYAHLVSNEKFTAEEYTRITQILREELSRIPIEIENKAKEAVLLMESIGAQITDFYQGSKGGLMTFFTKILADGTVQLSASADVEAAKLDTYAHGASGTGKKLSREIESILPALLQLRMDIITLEVKRLKDSKILDSLLPLLLNTSVERELQNVQEDQDLVLLSKFNIMINENLREEPSQFIYEKVGTRYEHFFFDEFQDTSEMQWQNFLPLRDHALSQDGTSFTLVGDPKQSIYRFRGGESSIMTGVLTGTEQSAKKADVVNLQYNWRSAKNIVHFNNKLYRHIGRQLCEMGQEIYGPASEQIAVNDKPGVVEVKILPKGNNAAVLKEAASRMAEDIQRCLQNGFRFSDMVVLVTKNDESKVLSEALSRKKVLVDGRETYIKTVSEKGLVLGLSPTLLAVTQLLYWQQNPQDKAPFSMMIYYLAKSGRISISQFTEEVSTLLDFRDPEKIAAALKDRYSVQITPSKQLHLNLYNYLEFYVKEFSVPGQETDFCMNYLELAFNFSQNAGFGLKDWLRYWEEEAQNMAIQQAENIDAIQLMTIHKSKGLEFPVVMLPLAKRRLSKKLSAWLPVEDLGEKLRTVQINEYFSDAVGTYDEQINQFTQQERNKDRLDTVNLLYVATTRAEEQLYLYLPEDFTSTAPGLAEFLLGLPEDKNGNRYYADEPGYEPDYRKQKSDKQSADRSLTIHSLKGANQAEKSDLSNIRIATPSKKYQQKNEQVRNGIFLHELLSRIRTEADLSQAVRQYEIKGQISRAQALEIEHQLRNIIELYPQYFAPNQQLLVERDFLITIDGEPKTFRPDRIIREGKELILVDFKSGQERTKYTDQLAQYAGYLASLGYHVKEQKIIYL